MDSLATIFVAAVTFLWYRKGRLWNFYHSIIKDSIEQITKDSLDREAWEKIAREKCVESGKGLFDRCLKFELEYLRKKIDDNKHLLWISGSLSDSKKHINVYDKEKYALYFDKMVFYDDFCLCSLSLFVNLYIYSRHKKKDKEDTGYTETSLKE